MLRTPGAPAPRRYLVGYVFTGAVLMWKQLNGSVQRYWAAQHSCVPSPGLRLRPAFPRNKIGPRKIGKPHADSFFLAGGNGPGVGGFCRAEGPQLAQLLPAAPKFRLRRILSTKSWVAHLGVAPLSPMAVWPRASILCLAECLRVPMPHGCTERRWAGLDQLWRLAGKEAGLAAIPEARAVHANGNSSAQNSAHAWRLEHRCATS